VETPRGKMQLRCATRRPVSDEYGFLGLAPKSANVKLSRLISGCDRGYAPDFPHVEGCRELPLICPAARSTRRPRASARNAFA